VKLIHNPNTTKAQLKAMQERIDASSSAHTLVGFYEVCPLRVLPNVDNVYVSGSADEQIRPEWEQSGRRAGRHFWCWPCEHLHKGKVCSSACGRLCQGPLTPPIGHNPHSKRSAGRVEKV